MKKIILATSNKGKLHELQYALSHLPLQILSLVDLKILAPVETGLTFIENALIKARHSAKLSHLPAIADDSGIVVDALDGQPGIYSSRFAGKNATDDENIAKLLMLMKDQPEEKRSAHFYCAMVFLRHALDQEPIVALKSWQGRILLSSRGNKGFGYDPIFYVPTHGCSAAELDVDEKNKVSHRGQAIALLKYELEQMMQRQNSF